MARVFKWTLGVIAVSMVIVLAGLAGLFRTEIGRSFLLDAAVAAAEAEGMRLSVARLSGALPFEATAGDIVLGDAEGEFLRLGGAEIRLDPAALLEGRVRFESIALDQLSITRFPKSPRDDAAESSEPAVGGPLLPGVPITVRALSISPLTLGPELAGEPVVLDIRSETSVDPDRGVDARFTVTRLDGDGVVQGELTSDAALTRLTASVTGESAKGGWVSRLLGLPGEPAIRVTLEGDGPVADFKARYGVFAGEDLRAEGTIRLSSIQPLALTLDGEARVAAFLPAEMRSIISGKVTYGLAAGMDHDASRIWVKDLNVDTPEISARGQIEVNLKTGTLAARASTTLLTPALAREFAPDLEITSAAVEAEAAGPLLGPSVNATILLHDLSLAGNRVARVEATVAAVLGEATDGTTSVNLAGIRMPGAPVGAIGADMRGSARFALKGDTFTLSDLEVQSGPAELRGDLSANVMTGAADFSADVTHAALEHVAPPLTAGRLEGTLHGGFHDGRLAVQLGGRVRDARSDEPNLAPFLASPPEFWVSANQISASRWEISSAELGNRAVSVSARGGVDLSTLFGDAILSARVDDVSVLDISRTLTRGSAEVTASASGDLNAATVDWTLLAKDFTIRGMDFPTIRGEGSLKSASSTFTGAVSVDAETPVGPARASTPFSWDGGVLGLPDIRFNRSKDVIRGALAITPAPLSVDGSLEVAVNSLADWALLAGVDLGGGLNARFEARPVAGKQRLAVDASFSNVTIAGETPLIIDRVELETGLDDVLGTVVVNARAVATQTTAGAVSADRVEVAVAGGVAKAGFEISGSGEVGGKALKLETNGSLSLARGVGINVDRLDIQGPAASVSLARPTEVTVTEEAKRLAPTSLALFGGTLDLAGEMTGERMALDLEARNISLPLIASLAGTRLASGRINATAAIEGPIKAPSGQFNLAMTDVKLDGSARSELPAIALEIAGTFDDGALESQAVLSGLGAVPFKATLATRVPGDQVIIPVRASMDWRGGLGDIVAALPIDGTLITGEAGIDLDFEGGFDIRASVMKPGRASGLISVREGRLEHFATGAVLDPINIAVRLDGSRLVVEELEAGDTTGGVFRVSGAVELSEPTRPEIALRAVMEAMTVVRRDDADVQLDAEIGLRSNGDRYVVSGKVVNRQTEIRLIGALPVEVEELVVEEVRDGVTLTSEPDREEASVPAPPIDLDIEFSAPGRIFVRGRGLESEWGGDTQISGTAKAPRLAGEIAPVRGGFEFAGRRFELGKGGVSFSGGADLDPALNISASHEGTDFTALVSVTGTPSKPEIDLSSDPSYPEDEILAKILFGKFTARLSATEALQLAQSTRTLLSGEPGTLDKIRGAIGVDVLTFAPGASEGELGRLKAGKYVRDDLFVGVEQGATAGSTRSIVEWYVNPKVTIEGTVGSSSESTLGIQRRWEY